jgi:class 3 adenylate cyclase
MLIGDNRVVSVMFSDIRSFTSISEKMNPDDLVSVLNSYFNVMVDIIMGRQGTVDKYIGDAIMAIFGAPLRHEDDGLQSVLAGIDMIEALVGWNEHQEKQGKPPFRIGVGINYGVVTVGNMGTEKKMDYTVIGDTVNLASRLEGLTKYYHQPLLYAESLHSKVKDVMPWRLLDTVAVKGKTKGVKIFTTKKAPSAAEKEAWDLHNEGMDEYSKRNFSRALSLFRNVQRILPTDEPAGMLMQRAQGYAKNPPPPSWNGVIEMTSK